MADLGVARPQDLLTSVPGKLEPLAAVPQVKRGDLGEPAASKRPKAPQKIPTDTEAPPDAEELARLIEELNQEAKAYRLRFEVRSSFGGVVVHIVDEESGEVLRTVPPQAVLGLRENLASGRGMLLDEQS